MNRWIPAFFVLLIFCYSYGQPPDTSIIIHGKGTRGPYLLGFRNLVSNSLTITKDGITLDSASFSADYSEGLFFLGAPVPMTDSLFAKFQYVPLNLKSRYYLHKLAAAGEAAPVTDPDPPPINIGAASSDLSISGSKRFSVQTGGGDGNSLSQSLNLTVRGDILPGLRTSAHISDKSSGQSGVTRRLEELDKIYIEAESERFKGIFGDFDYTESKDQFLNFQRKLTGLNVGYASNNGSLRGAAAFFPGEYSSITVTGRDGVLGPYYMTDVGGRQGASVLPGSEKVYVDGVLQKRGSQNDYEIDYGAGSIQFAPSKIIRNESRITIDYEIAREEYSRGFYAVSGDASPVTGLRVYSSLVQEGDNRNSPKSFEMTSDTRAILENAGADRLSAYESGIKHVGPGAGEYDLVTDSSSGVTYYRYVGLGKGEYSVSFSFIGVNAGSYRSSGAGVFEFVGNHQGEYEPVILIPLPQMKRYGSLGTSWISSDSALQVNGALAGTLFDRNASSSKDEVQRGLAGMGEVSFNKRVFGSDGFLSLKARLRDIGLNAIFPGRINSVERYREYDLDPASSSAGEKIEELELSGGPDKQRTITLGIGYLTRPDIESRKRQSAAVNWRLLGPLSAFSAVERTQGTRTWWKESGGVSANLAKIQPSLRINYESRDGLDGFKYYEYVGTIPAAYARDVSGQTEFMYRDEKSLDGTWRDKFRSGSIQQKISFTAGSSGFSGGVAASYYRKQYRDLSGSNTEQRTGWTRLSFSDPSGRGSFSLNERLSSSNERLQARNYVFVGQGKGEYKLEDGEYVRDAQGDYIIVIEELGQGTKITDISTEINVSASPFVMVDPGRGIETTVGRLNLDSDLTYRLKKSSDLMSGMDFIPWRSSSLKNGGLQNGQFELRVYYYPPAGKHRIRYNMSRSFQDGAPYVNEATNDNSRSDELSLAFVVSRKVDVIATLLTTNARSSVNSMGYAVGRRNASGAVNYRFQDQWILTAGTSYGVAKQTDTGLRASLPEVDIGLTRDFKSTGRISAKIAYTRLNVIPQGAYVPYQVAGGKRAGDNLEGTLSARLEVTKNGRLDFSYRYENFAQRQQKNNLKLEFTVLFL